MSGKSRFERFKKKTHIVHEISPREEGGKPLELEFYPCSYGMVKKLRVAGTGLAEALGKLMSASGELPPEVSTKTHKFAESEDSPEGTIEEWNTTPQGVDAVLRRADYNSLAWKQLADTLLDPATLTLLSEVILDSLQEPTDEASVQEFEESLDARTVFELLQGWMKANLGEISQMGQLLTQRAKAKLESLGVDPEEQESEDTGSSTTTPGKGSWPPKPIS